MLSHDPLLKTLFSCLIMIHLLRTCIGRKTPHFPPSLCGNIPNISYPFRLKNDPKYCDDPSYELECENNTTFLYLNSQKYPVQAINYSNHTISLTYPSILQSDNCSLPQYSVYVDLLSDAYSFRSSSTRVALMSCPYPLNNPLLLELKVDAHCGHRDYGFYNSSRKHTYIKRGVLKESDIKDMCTIDLILLTSMPLKGEKSVSLSEIHSALLYGFELEYFVEEDFGSESCTPDVRNIRSPELSWCNVGVRNFWCGGMPLWFVISFNRNAWILVCIIEYVSLPILAIRIIIGMSCILWLVIYKLRRRHLSEFDIIEGYLQSNNTLSPIRYSYKDIKRMTRGFREKLGQGGYGSVYKGKLRSGHIVAVKLLSNPTENGQDFINEIATIGRIHHVNVVKLVGYCAGRSNKRALIFDFMPNGSLDKFLFSQQSPNPLSWERKYEIAVGVARGVEYLHRGCDIQILHFDIKPHNILLDDNFTPKISDFGLAKLYSTDNTTVTLTAARGTIGYVAPELINRSIGSVSYKADVYSFGMLLMEMVGLNRNITKNNEESSQYFPYWIYDLFNKSNDIEMGDVDEDNDDDDDNANDRHAKRITRKMTIVGLWCIQMNPVDRPSMSEVVKMLESQNGNLQIPPRPSEPTQNFVSYSDETWGTESTGSMALFGHGATSDQ